MDISNSWSGYGNQPFFADKDCSAENKMGTKRTYTQSRAPSPKGQKLELNQRTTKEITVPFPGTDQSTVDQRLNKKEPTQCSCVPPLARTMTFKGHTYTCRPIDADRPLSGLQIQLDGVSDTLFVELDNTGEERLLPREELAPAAKKLSEHFALAGVTFENEYLTQAESTYGNRLLLLERSLDKADRSDTKQRKIAVYHLVEIVTDYVLAWKDYLHPHQSTVSARDAFRMRLIQHQMNLALKRLIPCSRNLTTIQLLLKSGATLSWEDTVPYLKQYTQNPSKCETVKALLKSIDTPICAPLKIQLLEAGIRRGDFDIIAIILLKSDDLTQDIYQSLDTIRKGDISRLKNILQKQGATFSPEIKAGLNRMIQTEQEKKQQNFKEQTFSMSAKPTTKSDCNIAVSKTRNVNTCGTRQSLSSTTPSKHKQNDEPVPKVDGELSGDLTTICDTTFLTKDIASDTVKNKFTPEEASRILKKIMKEIICSLKYETINIKHSVDGDEYKNQVIEITTNFILFQEGLVYDGCFTMEDNTDRYVPGKFISLNRIKKIQCLLKEIFTEQAEWLSRRYRKLSYRLGEILADYLSKKKCIPDDVVRQIDSILFGHTFTYRQLRHDMFDFFNIMLAEYGLFSEWLIFFNFAVNFRKKIINSAFIQCPNENLLKIGLRTDSNLRKQFNKKVIDKIFPRICNNMINTLFDSSYIPTDRKTGSVNNLNLKFGEELEYNFINKKLYPNEKYKLLRHFDSLLEKKGAKECEYNYRIGYHFGSPFKVIPFLDSDHWFEINCTPYYADNKEAKKCFKEVINVIDSMRESGHIDYASGHKHIDVTTATQGDNAVLLWLESDLQRSTFLKRAFGNNDLILQENECSWYKTIADFNPDVKPFALKRLNLLIDTYNKTIKNNLDNRQSSQKTTDSKNKENTTRFAHFYNQFVHMTSIQKGIGTFVNNHMEKHMAISLLHITGARAVKKLNTLEFRFFRCPRTVEEIELINRFLQAWFQYIHKRIKDGVPIDPIPEYIRSCKDYSAGEVQAKTIEFLRELGLNPEDYRCFWGEVRDIQPEKPTTRFPKCCTIL